MTAAGVSVVRHEERLRVDLERVPAQRVRVVRRIVTETRLVPVEVRREVFEIERSVLAEASGAGGSSQAGDAGPYGFSDAAAPPGPFVLTLREEVPTVTVEVRAVERVRVDVRDVVVQTPVTAELGAEQVEITGPPPRS